MEMFNYVKTKDDDILAMLTTKVLTILSPF
jgi:hypothetical protein